MTANIFVLRKYLENYQSLNEKAADQFYAN